MQTFSLNVENPGGKEKKKKQRRKAKSKPIKDVVML